MSVTPLELGSMVKKLMYFFFPILSCEAACCKLLLACLLAFIKYLFMQVLKKELCEREMVHFVIVVEEEEVLEWNKRVEMEIIVRARSAVIGDVKGSEGGRDIRVMLKIGL